MKTILKSILGLFFVLFSIETCDAQELFPFRQDSLWGFRDEKGEIKITPQYRYASKFVGEYAIVAKGNLLALINSDNLLAIPFQYEFLSRLDEKEFFFGDKTKYFGEYTMGIVTSDNRIKIPKEYNYISKTRNTYIVKKNIDSIIAKSSFGDIRSINSLYGLFSMDGKMLIPCEYNYLDWRNDSLLVLKKAEHAALFDRDGKQLTGFDYMVIGDFIEGIAKVRIKNKYGFIYPNGKLAIPVKFEYCEDFISGFALIKKGEKWGAINIHGKIVVKPNQDYKNVIDYLKTKYGRQQKIEVIAVDS